ncbi:hypothetical protein [Thalassorhabdomicrobium marinisediminis]|uniref:hypothetical protein n=1 Tax=Thalassorhabdomicrobium marinisediminis TaxID=2170577 RepID=UPI0024917F54|nr:hypothetical protein [Thalassorhabdomicrobium marinisediminis]
MFKNRVNFLLSGIVLSIAACTTFEDIDAGLSQFRGQHIDTLIGAIGFPDGEQTIAGRRLVYWNTDQTVTTTMPVTTYDYGSINAYGSGGYGYGNYSGTSTTYVPTTVNYNCTLKVQVDRGNRIVNHDFEGNIGGCERYASALRPYLPQS